ncbi:MAG TPA: hypothetical protein VK424_03795 [Thermoplasmata archaeon]|nr:hypothetical protein [Thermoplasmata archaeon]
MLPSDPPAPGTPPDPPVNSADRRWLHDKFERLAAEEGQLATGRTTYYAAIGTVLITGLLVVLADLLNEPSLLVVSVTFLAGLGILISLVWAVLLHRTNDAQNLWREAARLLERENPPVEGILTGAITLRSGETMNVNLLRPYLAHEARFAHLRQVSWMDRVDPLALVEVLPLTFMVIWSSVLVIVWFWYLLLR